MSEDPPLPEQPDDDLDYGQQARRNALEEGSGVSPSLARFAVEGTGRDENAGANQPATSGRPPRPRRKPRGTAYPQATDRDMEPVLPYEPVSPDELERRQGTTAAGHVEVEQAMSALNDAADRRTAARLKIPVQAARQLRLDKQQQRRRDAGLPDNQ